MDKKLIGFIFIYALSAAAFYTFLANMFFNAVHDVKLPKSIQITVTK